MNDALDRPIRKFNPGTFQTDDEVVRQFVVRQGELDLVLEVIRGNTDSPSCQHLLIVGPRGRGKTMLLARVGAELRTDNALSERLFPVRFMEESQEIATLADFWLEALFHLARANATGNPEFSRELLATHADLTARWRDTNIEECARAAFLEAADRLDRKVVLMVENLQALCSDLDDDFGWQLRQTLQSEPRLMMLATATSRFRGLDDANRPFFELFRIVELEPLSTDACRRLWNMVSGDKQTSREIRPLRILTGGSPRLLVIVATFARHRSLRQLLEELVTLVDDHTEYFRSHLEVLAKTERRVYLAVIDLWQSSSAHEIAARARVDIRTASALIARLVDRGAVVAEGTGRKRRYAAAERLYSIYYKLRRERDEAGLVRNLIQFMTVFYRSDELAEMVGTWRVEAAQSPPIPEGLEGVMHHERGEHETELAAFDDLVARFGASDTLVLQVQVAEALINKGITHGQRGESEAELAAYDDLAARFGASNAPELQVRVFRALLNKGNRQIEIGHAEEALQTCHEFDRRFGEAIDNESSALAFLRWQAKWMRTHALLVLNEHPAALSVFQSVCAMFVVGNEAMLREMLARVPILIAAGVPERDLVEILSADSKTADALAPLVVALRRLAGEPVRAPAEVIEVAADVCKDIEEAKRLRARLGDPSRAAAHEAGIHEALRRLTESLSRPRSRAPSQAGRRRFATEISGRDGRGDGHHPGRPRVRSALRQAGQLLQACRCCRRSAPRAPRACAAW